MYHRSMSSENQLSTMKNLLVSMRCEACVNKNDNCKCQCDHREGLCECEDCPSCRNQVASTKTKRDP